MKLFFNGSAAHLKRFFLHAGFQIGRYRQYAFADHEIGIHLLDDVRGKSTAIVGSILPDPQSFFELLMMHRILRDNHSSAIIIVISYFGYARQDRPTQKEKEVSGS